MGNHFCLKWLKVGSPVPYLLTVSLLGSLTSARVERLKISSTGIKIIGHFTSHTAQNPHKGLLICYD